MKFDDLKTFRKYFDQNFFKEKRLVWFGVEGPSATPPPKVEPPKSEAGTQPQADFDSAGRPISKPPEGQPAQPETPVQRAERERQAKDASARIAKYKLDETLKKQQQEDSDTMDALLKVAQNANGKKTDLPGNLKNTMVNYINKLKNGKSQDMSKVYQDSELDNNIKFSITKSEDGNYAKVWIYMSPDTKGNAPNVIKQGLNEVTMFLNAKGEVVKEPPKDVKFPAKEETIVKREDERLPDTKEGKLAQSLNKVVDGGQNAFRTEKGNIEKYLKEMNLNINSQYQTMNLPGGYRVFYHKETDGKYPEVIIFKDAKALCFQQNNQVQFATGNNTFEVDRYADNIAAEYHLDRALKDVKWNEASKSYKMSPNALSAIQIAIMTIAKTTVNLNKNTNSYQSWKLPESGATFVFTKRGTVNGIPVGSVQIRLPDGGQIAMNSDDPGKFMEWNSQTNSWSPPKTADKYMMTPEEQTADRKKDAADAKTKAEEARKAGEAKVKAEDEKLTKSIEDTVLKEMQNEEIGNGMKNLIKPRMQQHLKPDPTNPRAVTVAFKGKTEAERNRLDKSTAIHDLFDFKAMGNKVVYITITSGTTKTMGMYYPGQNTCYKLDRLNVGKQTTEQIKFRNTDKIEVDMWDPGQSDLGKVNVKNPINTTKSNFDKMDDIDLKLINKEKDLLVKKFQDLNGKPENLNLKASDFNIFKKFQTYKPEECLKPMANRIWQDMTKSDIVKALKVEYGIIRQGVILLETKKRFEAAKKQPTAAPSANPATAPAPAPQVAPAPPAKPFAASKPKANPAEARAESIRNALAARLKATEVPPPDTTAATAPKPAPAPAVPPAPPAAPAPGPGTPPAPARPAQ